MKLYHATSKDNRSSIARHGLLARDTTKWNFEYVDKNAGVEAVYVSSKHDFWADSTEYRDVYEIDATGLPIEPDPALTSSRRSMRILVNVPPDRIHRLTQEEFEALTARAEAEDLALSA